ncbi:MAG: corrinoid protein [Clostridiales Family XIII bacterium]|jgi:5-methyltetrahydrofolate--homocysteine methyltransferase|nr:corrinoid protein [Clostridiales Family XIII bacterium]
MAILEEISEMVQKGKAKDVVALVNQALEQGLLAQEILDKGLLKGMSELGVRFKNNEVFVPEVLIAARALNQGSAVLKSKLVEEGAKTVGTVVLATVAGDLHDIGKNLVRMMMEGVGLTVVDLGVDVPDDKIVEAVKEHNPDIVALSALLTTTMAQQDSVIKALQTAGLRDKVKVMVGGAPITQSFCDKIGADAYTPDASSAAELAKSLALAN